MSHSTEMLQHRFFFVSAINPLILCVKSGSHSHCVLMTCSTNSYPSVFQQLAQDRPGYSEQGRHKSTMSPRAKISSTVTKHHQILTSASSHLHEHATQQPNITLFITLRRLILALSYTCPEWQSPGL